MRPARGPAGTPIDGVNTKSVKVVEYRAVSATYRAIVRFPSLGRVLGPNQRAELQSLTLI
jgi:hypothetical protein